MTAEEIRRTGFPWVLLKIHFSNLLYVCTIFNLFLILHLLFFLLLQFSLQQSIEQVHRSLSSVGGTVAAMRSVLGAISLLRLQ